MPNAKKLPHRSHKMRVSVTQQHIDTAIPKSSGHCMISDAIKEAYPHLRCVSTDLATIRFTDPKRKERFVYLTPPSPQAALVRFDQAMPIKPFGFHLTSPAQILVSGGCSMPKQGKVKRVKRQTSKVRRVSGSHIPARVGGRPLPLGAIGKIRRYGLRVTTGGKRVG